MTVLAFLQYILAANVSPNHRSLGSAYRSGINPDVAPEEPNDARTKHQLSIGLVAALAVLLTEAISPQNLWSIAFFVIALGATVSVVHDPD